MLIPLCSKGRIFLLVNRPPNTETPGFDIVAFQSKNFICDYDLGNLLKSGSSFHLKVAKVKVKLMCTNNLNTVFIYSRKNIACHKSDVSCVMYKLVKAVYMSDGYLVIIVIISLILIL